MGGGAKPEWIPRGGPVYRPCMCGGACTPGSSELMGGEGLRMLFCRLRLAPWPCGGGCVRTGTGEEMPAMELTETEPARAEKLTDDVLDEVR